MEVGRLFAHYAPPLVAVPFASALTINLMEFVALAEFLNVLGALLVCRSRNHVKSVFRGARTNANRLQQCDVDLQAKEHQFKLRLSDDTNESDFLFSFWQCDVFVRLLFARCVAGWSVGLTLSQTGNSCQHRSRVSNRLVALPVDCCASS